MLPRQSTRRRAVDVPIGSPPVAAASWWPWAPEPDGDHPVHHADPPGAPVTDEPDPATAAVPVTAAEPRLADGRQVVSTRRLLTATTGGDGSTGTGAPASPVTSPRPRPERDDRIDDTASDRHLWAALTRARADCDPRVLAAAEAAVFRYYLPLARTLARGPGTRAPADLTEAERAAETGLAQAVLRWPGPDGRGFEASACAAIGSQLRRLAAFHTEQGRRRHPCAAQHCTGGDRSPTRSPR